MLANDLSAWMCTFASEAERRRLSGGYRKDLRNQTFEVVKANALKIWSMMIGAIARVQHPKHNMTYQLQYEARGYHCFTCGITRTPRLSHYCSNSLAVMIILTVSSYRPPIASIPSSCFTLSDDFHNLPSPQSQILRHRICRLDPWQLTLFQSISLQ